MMFVVSRRAVWMAHIWEIGGFCAFDDFNGRTSDLCCPLFPPFKVVSGAKIAFATGCVAI